MATSTVKRIMAGGLRRVFGQKLSIRVQARFQPQFSYLSKIRGVIHIGANSGQERQMYAAHGLKVIWIEPIPGIFEKLVSNIAPFPEQKAYRYLVTDRDEEEHTLYVADNDGASSSMLKFSEHTKMWPEVRYEADIKMKGARLATIIETREIDLADFDGLVLDTQGSELKILSGSKEILNRFSYIKVEVPDFESYQGCCQLAELSRFMSQEGFAEKIRVPFMHQPGVGTYFDVLYERSARNSVPRKVQNNFCADRQSAE
jgi:FkbM family methyltransferase